MKRIQVLGVALVAMVALSAIVASAASAVTFLLAEWLINGAALTAALLVEIPGNLLLINTNAEGLGIRVEILCSGILDGTVGPASEDLITSLLNLAGEEIGQPPAGLSLDCVNTKNCEGALVWAVKLPWKTELELMEDGTETFFVDLLLAGAYLAECTILGIKAQEECTSPEVAVKATNEAGGVVDSEFSDAFQELAGLKLGTCGGRAETAIVEELGTIKPDLGSLTVSSGP